MKSVIMYGTVLGISLVLDMIWLLGVASTFYRAQLGSLMTDKVDMRAAVAFYLLYGLGLVVFVVQPAMVQGNWQHALLWGALFGLVCYGTYDLTNLATLRGWPLTLAMVDMAWGAILSAVTAAVTVRLLQGA